MLASINFNLAEGINININASGGNEQIHELPANILSLLKKFKNSYDNKNIQELTKLISDSYETGSRWGNNKNEFTTFFGSLFKRLPVWTKLKLTIEIFHVVQNDDTAFKAIIDFKSDVTVWIIPIQTIDSNQVCVEVCPEHPYGIWKIRSILSTN